MQLTNTKMFIFLLHLQSENWTLRTDSSFLLCLSLDEGSDQQSEDENYLQASSPMCMPPGWRRLNSWVSLDICFHLCVVSPHALFTTAALSQLDSKTTGGGMRGRLSMNGNKRASWKPAGCCNLGLEVTYVAMLCFPPACQVPLLGASHWGCFLFEQRRIPKSL